MYKKISKTDYNEENIFWITMSDLLLGLMIIFLILFIMSMVGFSQAKVAEQSAQTEMAEKLAKKLVNNKIDVNLNCVPYLNEIHDLLLKEFISDFRALPKSEFYIRDNIFGSVYYSYSTLKRMLHFDFMTISLFARVY